MTEEQIRQNAIEASLRYSSFPHLRVPYVDGYIEGSHSCDEEIAYLTYRLNDTAEKLQTVIAERDNLRNLWIKVDDEHFPKCENKIPDSLMPHHRIRSSRDVIVKYGDVIQRGYYSYARERWEWNEGEINVDYWMPIPEVK